MQGIITTLEIPAKGFPKQPQMGTQGSPAPGKRANCLLSHARWAFRKCAGFLVGRAVGEWGGRGWMRDGNGVRGFYFVIFFVLTVPSLAMCP